MTSAAGMSSPECPSPARCANHSRQTSSACQLHARARDAWVCVCVFTRACVCVECVGCRRDRLSGAFGPESAAPARFAEPVGGLNPASRQRRPSLHIFVLYIYIDTLRRCQPALREGTVIGEPEHRRLP